MLSLELRWAWELGQRQSNLSMRKMDKVWESEMKYREVGQNGDLLGVRAEYGERNGDWWVWFFKVSLKSGCFFGM